VSEAEFRYSDLLPTGKDDTPYRLVTTEGVSTVDVDGQTFLKVSPEAIQRLTAEAMHDIAHYLRPSHLAPLRDRKRTRLNSSHPSRSRMPPPA